MTFNVGPSDERTGSAVDLLSRLIRNECVNDGTPGSGHEARSAEALREFLSGRDGLELEIVEAAPGRASLIANLVGDRTGPILTLLGHTDVVPANSSQWTCDPFAGKVEDGCVWGRGAVDMLGMVSCMATAIAALCDNGFRPHGTLRFIAVADEEAGGRFGTGYLLDHFPERVASDFVLTEWGGVPYSASQANHLHYVVGEKGGTWVRATFAGRSGHASRPYGAQNALLAMAKFVCELEGASSRHARVDADWERFVEALPVPEDVRNALVDPSRIESAIEALPRPVDAFAHACTRTTFSSTVAAAGSKTNLIPDHAVLEIDARTIAGQDSDDVVAVLERVAAHAGVEAKFEVFNESTGSHSDIDTRLWTAIASTVEALRPGARLIPTITTGANDARFYRRAHAVAYGGGLLSERTALPEFVRMFHGPDERIDISSIALSTAFFDGVARSILSGEAGQSEGRDGAGCHVAGARTTQPSSKGEVA